MVMMGERNTSAEAIEKLEARVKQLERQSNKWWSMAFTAEKDGKTNAAAKYNKKMEHVDDLQEGILEALGTLGVTWHWEDGGIGFRIDDRGLIG